MALTEKQELYISRYLEDVRSALHGHLAPALQQEAVDHLRLRILEEALKFAGDQPIDDLQLLGVLKQQGPAAERAEMLIRMYRIKAKSEGSSTAKTYAAPHAQPKVSEKKEETKPEPKTRKNTVALLATEPVWLGVCQHIATLLPVPLWAIRVLALLAGVVHAPTALLVYSGVFFFFNYSGAFPETKKVHYFRCVGHVLITAFFLILFYLAGKHGVEGIIYVFENFLDQPIHLPVLEKWAWLVSQGDRFFMKALFFLLPMALLSALPLSKEWALSLRRLTQAGVALYAILMALGIASMLAGILIEFYSEFTS